MRTHTYTHVYFHVNIHSKHTHILYLQDPKVKGVQLYISDFQRPITERLQKDFFSDPTLASVSCAKIGKVT